MQDFSNYLSASSREGFVEQEFHAGRIAAGSEIAAVPCQPSDVIAFWCEAGPSLWFAKDDAFDRRFRETFMRAHEAACCGELDDWQRTPGGALALILLLDQFPRNCFRGTERMYASDAAARLAANKEVGAIQMQMARRGQEQRTLREQIGRLAEELGLSAETK